MAESMAGAGKKARLSDGAFFHAWIEEAFRKRNLIVPGREEILLWVARNNGPEGLLEEVYTKLHRRAVLMALARFGLTRRTLDRETLSSLADRVTGGIIDLDPEDLRHRILEVLASFVAEQLRGHSDPVVLTRLITGRALSQVILAWSGRSGDSPKSLAWGLEALMNSRGVAVSRGGLMTIFRQGREALQAEKRLLAAARKARRDQVEAHRVWIRSMWTGARVRRTLAIRPREFLLWVAEGRIPVAIRVETRRSGVVKNRLLFDPVVIGTLTQEMVRSWREEPDGRMRKKKLERPEG